MKIVCYKENILKAINSVVKAVASKTTKPILEGILIQTNDKEIKLTSYDLEIGIEYIMECEVKEQGSTVVNAIMFSEIIRKLPDTEIYISLNEKNLLEIECEGSLYKLATMNPDEFPELPKIEIENSIELERCIPKILATAGLCHDVGNPPFGHFGETIIQNYFKNFFEEVKKVITILVI